MSPSISVGYENGRAQNITMYDPNRVDITDCRKGNPSFVTVDIRDGLHCLAAYLPPALAFELMEKLAALSLTHGHLFPPRTQKENETIEEIKAKSCPETG